LTTIQTEEAARLIEAAKAVLTEYRSHGGKGTHQDCPEGGRCFLPEEMDALEAAVGEADPGWCLTCYFNTEPCQLHPVDL
jgi:hypothetical protein